MVDGWIREIKEKSDSQSLGMILVHNGVVRGSSKDGCTVQGMLLSYNKELLELTVQEMKTRDGIVEIKVWINEGELRVGDDIMYVLVAGRFRTDILPVFQELLTIVKTKIVDEKEIGK
jgi:molybdopterin synthase catalytic subunit